MFAVTKKRHMEKDREEWTSPVHGSSPCSCKCSTGPSGRPCPTSACASWTTLSPTMELMPLCKLLNTKCKDELSSQSTSNDTFQLGCFLMCSYTNENTSTCRARNVCTVAGLELLWSTGTWLNGFHNWTLAEGECRVFTEDVIFFYPTHVP